MAPWGDREEILNVPNESINRGNVNPDTLLRRIIPGSGVLLAGTGVGDETIMAASPAVIWDGLSQGQNLLTTASGYAWAISGLSSGPGDWRDDLVARLLAGSPAQTDLEFYAGDAATSDEEWRVSWYKRSDWPYYGQFVISAATNAIIYRTKEQDTGWQHQFQVYDHTPLELGYSWVDVNQPIRWDTNDFMSYSAGDNEYIFWIGDVEKHWFGDEMYALRKDAGGNVTVGIRSAGSPREFQMRDDDVGAWRSLGDFVLNTRSLTAGSGLTGGGTLAADRTFHVGAGTGIMTNLNAVYAASPALWWHANAATPAIHEIRPDTSGTTRLGYDTTDKRWVIDTEETTDLLQLDAGTMVVSASYGLRLAGPAQRYFNFDTGWDCFKYDTGTNELKYHVGSDSVWSVLLGATGKIKLALPSATLTVVDVSASGTLTGASGYLEVQVGGQTRYIPLYTAVV